jgi:hypothetical protein
MKKRNQRGATHCLFLPDLAPSDFFLFGHIIDQLQGTELMENDDLLAEIREILNAISGKILRGVSIEWEHGCKSALMQKLSASSQ